MPQALVQQALERLFENGRLACNKVQSEMSSLLAIMLPLRFDGKRTWQTLPAHGVKRPSDGRGINDRNSSPDLHDNCGGRPDAFSLA